MGGGKLLFFVCKNGRWMISNPGSETVGGEGELEKL
jgi:hypothetical protein